MSARRLSPVEAVIAERRLRGWSQRVTATAGGISNQAWSDFERTGTLTPRMRQAVATAFGWSMSWPENPLVPTLSAETAASILARLEVVEDRLVALARMAVYLIDRERLEANAPDWVLELVEPPAAP